MRRYRADNPDSRAGWKIVPGGSAARRHTVPGLRNGTEYVFEVLARNVVGDGPAAETTATPQAVNEPPGDPDGPSEVSFSENGKDAVVTYTRTRVGSWADEQSLYRFPLDHSPSWQKKEIET